MIKEDYSYSVICHKYGIGKSTVSDIKNGEDKILSFKDRMITFDKRTAKCMKLGKFIEMDEALYMWFRQEREKGCPVSGPLLAEKANILYNLLYPENLVTFTASSGYLTRFKKRYHIRNLSITGEKLSADMESAVIFVDEFKLLTTGYTSDQICNSDETGLYYRTIPDKTLVSWFEKSAAGYKQIKERITINVCSNANGSIKFLSLGKLQNHVVSKI